MIVLQNGGGVGGVSNYMNTYVHCSCSVSLFRIVNKQNRFPCLLLTQGRNTKYEDYRDPRTWTIPAATWFGQMVGLLGESRTIRVRARDGVQEVRGSGARRQRSINGRNVQCRLILSLGNILYTQIGLLWLNQL